MGGTFNVETRVPTYYEWARYHNRLARLEKYEGRLVFFSSGFSVISLFPNLLDNLVLDSQKQVGRDFNHSLFTDT